MFTFPLIESKFGLEAVIRSNQYFFPQFKKMYGRNQDPVKAHDVYIPIFYIASLLTITKLSLIES